MQIQIERLCGTILPIIQSSAIRNYSIESKQNKKKLFFVKKKGNAFEQILFLFRDRKYVEVPSSCHFFGLLIAQIVGLVVEFSNFSNQTGRRKRAQLYTHNKKKPFA